MTWKQFKTWLDKNIITNEGLVVKIRTEKQNKFGKLSPLALTNFCDSLEATLDKNNSYHLFPNFTDDKSFEELFNSAHCYFGKRTNQEKTNERDYFLLKKLFYEWKNSQQKAENNLESSNQLIKETNWKEFARWLQKEVITADDLQAKIKSNKQDKYGKISVITLTNFCDSLEATLDKNSSYHLFPTFDNDKSFEELFPPFACHFGKKTNQERIKEGDYSLLEKMFYDWKKGISNQKNNLINLTINSIRKHSNYYKIGLDKPIAFQNNQEQNYFYCGDVYPFNTYKLGDEVEIDTEKLKEKNNLENITDFSLLKRTKEQDQHHAETIINSYIIKFRQKVNGSEEKLLINWKELEEIDEWAEKIGILGINEKIANFKELIEKYKLLKQKGKAKEELEQQLRNKKEALTDAQERYEIFANRQEKLIKEKTQLENKKDNTSYSIQVAEEEINQKHQKKINIQERIAKLEEEKIFLEAALGKDFSTDQDNEEGNEDKKPYQVLGIEKDASLEDIKRAYRILSLKYHPDKQHGKSEAEKLAAEEKMRKINEAYEKLTGSKCEDQDKEEIERIEKEREDKTKELWRKFLADYLGTTVIRNILVEYVEEDFSSLRFRSFVVKMEKDFCRRKISKLEEIIVKLKENAREWRNYYLEQQSLFEEQVRLARLVKERTNISGTIEEVIRFKTWWSDYNVATVINYYEGYYWVFLLVYDPVYSTYRPAVFPESSDCAYWGDSGRGRKGHNCLSEAKNEADWLRSELSSSYGKYHDNPVLLIHPTCDYYRSFETFVREPYVTRSSSHSKPLDIVKIKNKFPVVDDYFYHFGVFVGSNQVCHFTKEQGKVSIDSWNEFVRGGYEGVISFHPVIPFKNYKNKQKFSAKNP